MYYIILHDARMARSKHLSEAQDQLHDSVDLRLIPVARGYPGQTWVPRSNANNGASDGEVGVYTHTYIRTYVHTYIHIYIHIQLPFNFPFSSPCASAILMP